MESVLIPMLIAGVFAVTPKLKYAAQTVTTITHELGHAIAVMPFGGRLQGIKLRLTTEGEAIVSIPRWPFPLYHIVRILNLFAGYSAPVYLAMVLIASVTNGWLLAAKIILGAMCVLIVLFIRNWFGFLIALLFAGLNVAMISVGIAFFDEYVLTLAFILLFRGVTDIWMAGKWTFTNTLKSSDFVYASDELFGPPQLWFVLFCLFHIPVMLLLSFITLSEAFQLTGRV